MHSDIGSPERSDDGSDIDSVSITSTVLSEQKDEYPLEAILAEEKFNGVTKYLVKWEGYPEYRCTWETRSNFQDGEDSTFHEWETQKMRVSRGLSKPFDIPAFKKRVEKWLSSVEERKIRRRLKRQRMGLPVSPVKYESEDSSTDTQADEEEERPKIRRTRSLSSSKTASGSRSPGDSEGSEAMETDSSNEAPHKSLRQWTSQEEGALERGLKLCQGPKWKQILGMYESTLHGFTVTELEDQATRMRASFLQSGKEVPQHLRFVSEKPSTRATEGEVKQRRSSSRKHSFDAKRDRGSETDDSLIEELRSKHEARKRRQTQKLVATKETGGSRAKLESSAREERLKKSIKSKPRTAREPKDKNKLSKEVSLPIKLKQKTSALEPYRNHVADDVSHSKMFQQTQANSHPSLIIPTAPVAPMSGAQRVEPYRPRPRPQTHMGAIGRGPSRNPSNNVFLLPKKKRHAEGAAVLSNWDASRKPHGNSSMALKSSEASDKLDKWNKHSIRRRAVKKGRTEPAPNMDSLQLINPKDGKAVKKPSIATPVNTKSAYEMIRETAAQKGAENHEVSNKHSADDLGWMDAIEEDVTVGPDAEPQGTTIPIPAKSGQPAKRVSETNEPPVINTKKKRTLSLQAYMGRVQIDSTPGTEVAPTSGLPTDATVIDSPGAVKPAPLKPFALPTTTNQPSHQAPPLASGRPSPLDHVSSPVEKLSSDRRPIPPGFTSQPDQTRQTASSPLNSPVTEGAALASEAMLVPGADPMIYGYEKNDVFGDIQFGPERNSLGPVRFRGIESRNTRKRLIANNSGPKENLFWLSQLCTAADYKFHFHTDLTDPSSLGHVVPYSYNLASINGLVETLRLNVSGALYHGSDFTMLVYPPNSEDWAFLDRNFPEAPAVGLRCLIRTPIQSVISAYNNDRMDGLTQAQERRHKPHGFVTDEPSINAVMRNIYHIHYQRIIRHENQKKDSENLKFFLIFPKERKAEQDLVLQLIDANGPAEVYSYDEEKNDGGWDYFSKTVKEGVVIVHSTFWRFHQIPGWGRLMNIGTINVWSLSLRKCENESRHHLTRLFPHGAMLLITDSLILRQPLEVVRILTWFRLRVKDTKPDGTWKIITRPHIRKFLTHCCRERKLDEEGKPFVQMYEQIAYMLDPEELYDWEEDEPKEEAPIYCMKKIKSFNTKVGRRVEFNEDLDLDAISRNDEVLVDFFAGWASVHVKDFRRFQIISGFSEDGGTEQRNRWVAKWSYFEAFTPAALYRRYKVPIQADLDKEAAVKHQMSMQILQTRDEEMDQVFKEEEVELEMRKTQMDNDWRHQLKTNPKLKETYEGLMKSMDSLPQLGEDATAEINYNDDEDDWSNDDSSVATVEMDKTVEGDEDEVMVDAPDSSEIEAWSLTESDDESESNSDR